MYAVLLIKRKQHTSSHSMRSLRRHMSDDPLSLTLRYVMSLNTSLGKLICHMVDDNVPSMSSLMCNVHNARPNSHAARCIAYKSINPQFKVHDVFIKRHFINEYRSHASEYVVIVLQKKQGGVISVGAGAEDGSECKIIYGVLNIYY